MKLRLGLIARMDNTGLGIQTHDLYKYLKPHKTFVIDLSELNASNGKITANFPERYPNAEIIQGFPSSEQCDKILDDIDVLFTVEIPYNYELFAKAKLKGVKTILHYNYEFLDYLEQPNLPTPDLLLAPSIWHFDDVRNYTEAHLLKLRYLPPPVDRQVIPYRHRTSANHFVHVAGHKTFMDRNGTDIVMASLVDVKSPITVTIHSQDPIYVGQLLEQYPHGDNIDLRILNSEVKEYQDIYNNPLYDVLLLPRRYGGLSLQLNEALSAGMPVIMSNVSPQNSILPTQALIDPEESIKIHTRTELDCYSINSSDLARRIDQLYAMPQLVASLSLSADEYAKKISWEAMLPKYEKLLDELCRR